MLERFDSGDNDALKHFAQRPRRAGPGVAATGFAKRKNTLLD
jgi:hypothetical protein